MSHLNRGLFDPPQKMVHWPEPNDDPNIPYVWGLSGYPRSNPSPVSGTQIKVESTPVPTNAPSNSNEPFKIAAGVAITLGAVGLYDGYTQSQDSSMGGKAIESLATGLIYATGIGFIVSKLKG